MRTWRSGINASWSCSTSGNEKALLVDAAVGTERDVDWINDAAKPLCLALPPRVAADIALSVAEAVDRRVAAVSDAIIEANARAGTPLNWRRAEHRREHLDEIERALPRA